MDNILVGLDFSDVPVEVIDRVSEFARALSAKLWLSHVGSPEPDFVGYKAGPQTVRDQVALELRDEHRRTQQVATPDSTIGFRVVLVQVGE